MGLIKNDHFRRLDFSPIAMWPPSTAPFGIRDLGVGKANKRLLETIG